MWYVAPLAVLGSNWLLGSLRGLNLLLRSTQGFRPGLNYVALRGLFFAVNCRRGGLTVRHRSSIECCGGRSSRFAFPTFRTGRERWGSRHFWLFEVLGLTPWAKFMSSLGLVCALPDWTVEECRDPLGRLGAGSSLGVVRFARDSAASR